MTRTRMFAVLAGFLLASFAAAAIGGLATARGVAEWYPGIEKPSWTPPSWLFGPVWTVLYAAMGVAAWLVWRRTGSLAAAPFAFLAFFTQLALNAAWSVLFFGQRSPALALADIVALWAAIAATIVVFARLVPLAGWMLLPYLAWVTFAAVLNFAIWRLN